MATVTAKVQTSNKSSDIVSCFVAKCTETVISALLHNKLKSDYLQKFSISNPIQRDAAKAFLHGETHYVFPAITQRDRVDFVKLYAVLCSSVTDEKPMLLDAIVRLFPQAQTDNRLLGKTLSNAAVTEFAVGVLGNRQDLIEAALGKNGAEEISDYELACRMDEWRRRYQFGFIPLNPYGCALLLLSIWSKDSTVCLNTLRICERCSNIVNDAEVDLNLIREILQRSSFSFTVNDYTQSIRSGVDLVARMRDYYDVYDIADVVVDETIASYSLSSINALWYADFLQPRTSIALLLGSMPVKKEDRYLALRCALFHYTVAVFGLEQFNQDNVEQYGDFTALCRLYVSTDLQRILQKSKTPLQDALGEWPAKKVMDMLRKTSDDCVATKFEEIYLLSLYKILVERIIIKQQCEEAERVIFARQTVDKDTAQLTKELEKLYDKCRRQTDEIEELKANVQKLQTAVEEKAQFKANIERKNAIIAELRQQIAALQAKSDDTAKEADIAEPQPTEALEEEIEKDDEITDEQVHERLLSLCREYSVVLVDGHENFQRRLQEVQPEIKMLSKDEVQRKNNVFASADFIFSKSSAYGSHSVMTKVLSAIKGTKAQFVLLSKVTNVSQCEREMYMAIWTRMNKASNKEGRR